MCVFEKYRTLTQSSRDFFIRIICVFFSYPPFIPDPTGRKQDRKITVDRVYSPYFKGRARLLGPRRHSAS